jgi:hypothetical protein
MLQRRGRMAYRTLKRQSQLMDMALWLPQAEVALAQVDGRP